MDDSLHLQLTLRAIRCANVRFGILPAQSRLRGNDASLRNSDFAPVRVVADMEKRQ